MSELYRYQRYERERRERLASIIAECAERTAQKMAKVFADSPVKFKAVFRRTPLPVRADEAAE